MGMAALCFCSHPDDVAVLFQERNSCHVWSFFSGFHAVVGRFFR